MHLSVCCIITMTGHVICRVGRPVTLCWRLERAAQGLMPTDSPVVRFEAHSQVSCRPAWPSCFPCLLGDSGMQCQHLCLLCGHALLMGATLRSHCIQHSYLRVRALPTGLPAPEATGGQEGSYRVSASCSVFTEVV